jgi:hypothetical protein
MLALGRSDAADDLKHQRGTNPIAKSSPCMSRPAEPSEFEQALARVFDRAWDAFLASAGPEADTAENRGSLAARIVVIAKLGERDEEIMAGAALLYLRALLAAKALRREERSTALADVTPGPVLDQESITAAVAAYDACIEELPEGISEYARSTLLESVMDNAGKGIRDAARLRELALEKLRLRK